MAASDSHEPTLVLEPGVPGAEELSTRAPGLGLAVATTDGPHDDAGHVQVARLARHSPSNASRTSSYRRSCCAQSPASQSVSCAASATVHSRKP